ncbi:hypothetical protein CCAX7_008610 [Capsulimonas corticalis]|uniref:Uncharacterized protein n=1 Tax=Capsulimonas corticalis TaxID=2219043 RepID=A0A402CU05_9BACT|nr:sigma-70 family RNA polymerase sigma factor [Capsulimonas corticalis]BDI28810.1 hypothetical protein CCAX7_008610 [Capsulimonas corticalis]
MQDHQLIRKYVESGSNDAFRTITARYINLVYATCLRQVGDRQTAEDATQAVFILLAQKAPRLKPDTPLAGWLFHASRLVARNARKRERRYAAMLRDARPQLETETTSDVALMLDDAVSRLSEKDRQAILLRFYQELSFAEIGARIGVSEDAAGKRVSRAVERLRVSLGKAGAGVLSISLLAILESDAAHSAPPELANTIAAAITGMGDYAGTSAGVLKLAQGAAQQMMRTKLIVTASSIGAIALCAGVAGTAYGRYASAPPHPSTQKTAAPLSATPQNPKVTLADGTIVELLGVTADQLLATVNGHAYSQNGWWTASGDAMADPPGTPSFRVGQTAGSYVPRELCFRVTTPASGTITTEGKLIGFTTSDYGGNLNADVAPAESAVVEANKPSYALITADLPDNRHEFGYRLGVSTGEWRVLADTPLTLRPARDDMFISHGGYVAGPSVNATGAPIVYYLDRNRKIVSQNLLPPGQTVGDEERRAEGLDAQGQIVAREADGIWSPESFLRIATIRLEHRPRMWAQFDHIAGCAKSEIPMPQAQPQFQQTMGDATVSVLAVVQSRADGHRCWLPDGTPITGKVQGLAFAGPDAWSISNNPGAHKIDVQYYTQHGRLSIIYDISRPQQGPPWRTFSAEVPGAGSPGQPATGRLPSSIPVTVHPGQSACALDIQVMATDPRLPPHRFHFDKIALRPRE